MFDLDENRPDYFTDEGSDADRATDTTPAAGSTLDFDGSSGREAPQRPRRRMRRFVAWTVTVSLLVLAAIIYLRYYNPYVTDSRVTAYVASVERRGIIFKTYEADLISESALTDTSRVYSRNITVTIPSAETARALQALQGTGRKVTLTTERYYGMLPWRGASTTVVTAIVAPEATPR